MRLILLPVVDKAWSNPTMQHAVEQARDAARRIRKRVDLSRERTRFTMACDTIQDLALSQLPTNAVAFIGRRANDVIAALPRDGEAVFPFASGEDLPRIQKLVIGKQAQKVDGALALVTVLEASPGQSWSEVGGALPTPVPSEAVRQKDAVQLPDTGTSLHRSVDVMVERALAGDVSIPWIDASHADVVASLRRRLFVEEIPMHEVDVSVPRTVFDEAAWERIEQSLWYRIRQTFLPFLLPKSKPTKIIKVMEKRIVPAPIKPRHVCVTFQDGSKSAGFPLRALAPSDQPTGGSLLNAALISVRHFEMDKVVEVAVLRNAEIGRRGKVSFSEQEELAFKRGYQFFEGCLQHTETLEVHLFHTGLEPAVLGVYRAVVELLRNDEHRGRLVVVPRVLHRNRYDRLEAWF